MVIVWFDFLSSMFLLLILTLIIPTFPFRNYHSFLNFAVLQETCMQV